MLTNDYMKDINTCCLVQWPSTITILYMIYDHWQEAKLLKSMFENVSCFNCFDREHVFQINFQLFSRQMKFDDPQSRRSDDFNYTGQSR